MKQSALATVWLEVQADLLEPDLIWQLGALAGCLLLALQVGRPVALRLR